MYRLIIIILIFLPFTAVLAQDNNTEQFRAKIIEIVASEQKIRDNGTYYIQQDLKLKGISGDWEDKEVQFKGISDFDIPSQGEYKEGERVIVRWSVDFDGQDRFFITGYDRSFYIYILGLLFCLAIYIVGRKKGIRSLVSLVISFFIITKFIIPQIMAGHNPLLIALIGSGAILGIIIYTTDGFCRKTHLSVVSVMLSLLITFILSLIFVKLTQLTGFASEESGFLVNLAGGNIVDFRGLLMAGILIGTLGVLDDVILGQMEVVSQVQKLNPDLDQRLLIKSANEIGRTHLGAIINTLFLTYAGASLPILILFASGGNMGLNIILSNEAIATEIVRTLTGSIGLTLAFPITTYIGVKYLKKKL